MASLAITAFAGTVPKTAPRLLASSQAQVAENCQLQRGILEPLPAPGPGVALVGATIFKMGDRWLSWSRPVEVAKSFVFADNKRFMWTGDDYPKVSDLTIWPASKRLGVPAPTVAPSVEFIDNPSYTPPESTDTDDNPTEPDEAAIEVLRSCAYVYTAVNEWGEESAPSPPSPVVDVRANQLARVINMRRPEKNGVTITTFRLYRTVSGSNSAEYQFLAEVDATLSNCTDEKLDDELGDICGTIGYTMPPDDLRGLLGASNMLFGFRANEVWVSVSSIPYAWPEAYKIATEDDVVGLSGFGSTMVALTKTRPYVISGVNPDALTVAKAQFDMPCLAAKSIVATESAVLFASPDGLIAVSGADGYANLTKDLYTKDQWAALHPETLLGVYYDARYYGFFAGTGTGFILDFSRGEVTTIRLGITVAAVRYVPEEDVLYLHDGTARYAWAGGATPLSYTWRSKQFFSREPVSLSTAMVSGGAGNMFRFFVDGVSIFESPIVSDAVFRLPGANLGQTFEIEIVGTAAAESAALATSTVELYGPTA